ELSTGRERFLTTTGHPEYSAISHTSKQVAYIWHDPNWMTPSLFTVGLDGSDRRCIRQGDCLVPKDWSVDDRKILALESDKDPKQLVWVSAADGSLEHIVSVDKGYPQGEGHPGKFDVSLDGRFIAYSRLQSEDAQKRDIFLFDLQKNNETVLVKHPANDRLLGWTPDGTSIFFASDRSGTWDGWLQRVTDGEPQGFPQLVRRNIGDVTPIGFAQGGSFYYRAGRKPMRDVFTVAMDFDKGQVLASPMPVYQTGTSHFAAWSPDGQKLAYCTGRPGETKIIHIRTLTTGEEHEINTELPVFAFPYWSADGRSIVGATARERPHSIYKFDIQTGERTELLRSTTGTLWQCELFPDGETLLYARNDTNSKTRHYVVRNLTTGHEKDLIRATRGVRLGGFALSPDKQRLAYTTSVRGPGGYQALKIIPAAGGESRELFQFDESEKMWLRKPAWMPDSQDVLFVKWLMEDKGGELWRISAQGGEPFTGLCVHPDGQRIAFHTSKTTNEMWVMENFLPQDVGK
ncbi:MAG: TolB family protein, partial [Planctomycetota bacterium]